MQKTLLSLLALLLAGDASQEQPRVFVPFHTVSDMILFDAWVNGKPASLLLDTGASDSMVDGKSVGKLRSSGTVAGAEGTCAVREVDLTLRAMSFHRQVCVIDLSDASRHIGTHIDGIIGQDVLQEFSAVRIDYRNRVVECEQ